TDSTTYLPAEYLEKYVIRVAPASVIWTGEELQDGIDILPAEFYSRLESDKEMPTTSQATPIVFKTIFEELLAEGYDILTIVISSKLSGTVASVEHALQMMPDANIELIDSMSGSMGAGWPVLEAAKAAADGANLAECKAIAERALENVGILLTVETLDYLHRGGRIGGAQRFLGAVLNMKPILEIADGGFEGLERVRTYKKAQNRLVELLQDRIDGRSPVRLAVLHANAPDVAKRLLEQASEVVHPIETIFTDVSPAVGVHLGPGTVGLAFMAGIE
ncbi:MAG: DegV family protein, partial [Anaerolineaceae bacterium]|nr:DegV family protein [Anaerolineaceae bacterium]